MDLYDLFWHCAGPAGIICLCSLGVVDWSLFFIFVFSFPPFFHSFFFLWCSFHFTHTTASLLLCYELSDCCVERFLRVQEKRKEGKKESEC